MEGRRGCMYAQSEFPLFYSRNQHNVVKQLHSNFKKKKERKSHQKVTAQSLKVTVEICASDRFYRVRGLPLYKALGVITELPVRWTQDQHCWYHCHGEPLEFGFIWMVFSLFLHNEKSPHKPSRKKVFCHLKKTTTHIYSESRLSQALSSALEKLE